MPEFRGDQADGLRRLFGGARLRAVTFVAAGPGVGRSHVLANLAWPLAHQGKRVLVIDENPPPDNISGIFGRASSQDMLDVVRGRVPLEAVLVDAAPGLRILPAARAVSVLGGLSHAQHEALLRAVAALRIVPDVILVDAAHDHPLGFSPFGLVSAETVVVLAATAPAITAAYALIKRVSQAYGRRQFRILVNKVGHADEAQRVFFNLERVAGQKSVASLALAGFVPLDDAMTNASRCCRPVAETYPNSPSALALRGLAADLEFWPAEDAPLGLEQFMRQLLHLSQRITPSAIAAR